MSLLIAFVILTAFLKAGMFAEVTPDFQLLCMCIMLGSGLIGMRGGKND